MRIYTGTFSCLVLLGLFSLFLIQTEKEWRRLQATNESIQSSDQVPFTIEKTSYLVDQDGNEYATLGGIKRQYVHLNKIPTLLHHTFILSEDQYFYEHIGFDASAILRAFVQNQVSSSIQQGGSTITQQLARNVYLSHEQTYERKIQELIYANVLEKNFSKEEILEMYMNAIYFSNGIYGVETAATYYFGRSLQELSDGELLLLAAIPNNPSRYDPILHFERAKERQERLIDQLVIHGYYTQEQGNTVKEETVALTISTPIERYPDYRDLVLNELEELYKQHIGYENRMLAAENEEQKTQYQIVFKEAFNAWLQTGLVIETALDPVLQQQTTDSVTSVLTFDSIQGSAVVIDNSTRNIVAISGGVDYSLGSFNRAFQAYRQPGSAIKPLLVYAPYIERTGLKLQQLVNADKYCVNGYCPKNYGGREYGQVPLETAFIHSYNTPAVRLLNQLGIETAFSYLEPFTFQHIVNEDKTLAAAVGGFTRGMSPLELTGAYTSFINGKYVSPRSIVKVIEENGNVITWNEDTKQVWKPDTVNKIRNLLASTAKKGTGRKAYAPLPYMGVKTGTTNDYHDYWMIGLTDTNTIGVWVGKDTPSNLKYAESTQPAQQIWKRIATN
ncbi:hypothetical protein Q73_11945 [Bacillus coahuilensis m2-6]|uniref:transglycosylase domain-containing protein n=1 Tax=Bacillus coahuilensis TaxID=408580 RepID=UPI0007501F80|nr:transglycosylase domain-containing protein [Bacillus coahuilensis]KUP06088.1 hypothetical protein Q73_11945 [Bacillus coahuilensis m2-6]